MEEKFNRFQQMHAWVARVGVKHSTHTVINLWDFIMHWRYGLHLLHLPALTREREKSSLTTCQSQLVAICCLGLVAWDLLLQLMVLCYNEMAWIWTQGKNWCITVWASMDYFFFYLTKCIIIYFPE